MKPTGETVHVRLDQNHMATTFEFHVSCAREHAGRAERALEDAHREIARLETELTEFRDTSPVWRLNHAAPGEEISIPDTVLELLERSARLRELSGGAFDCLAKSEPLTALDETPRNPRRVDWDRNRKCAWRNDLGAHLSFGAIGKGYALDRVRASLERAGFRDYLLSGGGSSIIVSGLAGPSSPWRFGWSWEREVDGAARGLALAHRTGEAIALGISGTHQKGRHLLDPRVDPRVNTQAARAATADTLSALVATGSAADADALSTALFVAGWDEGLQRIADYPASVALAQIDAGGVPRWNGIFHRLWGALGGLALVTTGYALLAASSAIAQDAATVSDAAATSEVDLGAMGAGADVFNPYNFERAGIWALLPLLSILLVVVHLKKIRRNAVKTPNIRPAGPKISLVIAMALIWSQLELAQAVEFEPMGKALAAILGTTKVQSKIFNEGGHESRAFFLKEGGKVTKVAFLEKGLYEPNCTHTWAIGLDAATGKVNQVRVIEMSCQHAYPTKAATYLEQYKGKGPADLAKLDEQVTTIANATGSSKLTTEAVIRSVNTFAKHKSEL